MTAANNLSPDSNASTPEGNGTRHHSKRRNHPSPGITIERAGAITAVITSFSLAMSFAYDWGFFSGLGISFAEAPTTVSDHFMTWLMWLPVTIPGLLLVLVMEVTYQRSKGVIKVLGKDKLLPLAKWLGLAVLAYWLLLGNRTFFALGAGTCWMWFMARRMRHPTARRRSTKWFRLVAVGGPALPAIFYGAGYGYATRSLQDARAYVEFHEEGLTDSPLVRPVSLLRSFDDWLLVRADGKRIRWIRSERVQHIEIIERGKGFDGILCAFLNVCVTSEDGNSTSPVNPERPGRVEATKQR